MTIEDQIEIEASPERVREVFLDFTKYKEWHTEYISSIAPVEEGKKGKDLAKGEKLRIVIHGQKFEAVVTENTSTTFQWQGPPVYTIAGLHTFEFLPSSIKPGSTTFTQNEIHTGALSFMLAPNLPTGKSVRVDFETLCKDLKRRVEGS